MTDIKVEHDDVWLLLPWYVNDTLQPTESNLVTTHLQTCLTCRREIENLQLHAEAIRDYEPQSLPVEHSLEKLMHKIESDGRMQRSSESGFTPVIRRASDWVKSATQSFSRTYALAWSVPVLIICLVLLWPSGGNNVARFHTLSDPVVTREEGNLKLIVDKRISVEQLQALLQDCRVKITGGPSDIGAYTLRTQIAQAADNALNCLRGIEYVQFAEPLGEENAP